jgi:hypothetical protein
MGDAPMDVLIWLGVMTATGVAVWLAAPHHQRLITNRAITNEHASRCLGRKVYRPELHYMRGPGPKWYEKHQGRIETNQTSHGTVDPQVETPKIICSRSVS